MKVILESLQSSIDLFPEDGYVNKNYASKPAAYALKADVLMWKAKVLGGGESDLREAIKAIDEVGKSGVSLLPTYSSVLIMQIRETKKLFSPSILNVMKRVILV